ncbi:MAG: 1-acyl-sn-glycerol-3-phosphate acyltransferase [Flavobacteriaceae bacterium]|nr:1-acyl-sn-glycerol-3-phosphate acyltransferase [Flavobacteriaceae bacterium]
MKKITGKFMLAVVGWKFKSVPPIKAYKKSVLVCAPHTSNWDFYYGIAAFWSMGISYRILIKDNYTRTWYGFIFKALGCIGVDRSRHTNLVEYTAELIKNSESMALINTPEGTRSWSDKWKKGFYYIAKEAGVPIALAYGDYKNKIAGIHCIISVEDKTIEQVFEEIEQFYTPEMAKFPEKYNPKIY